ncbi:MAG: HAD family hydrolase [Desulfurococcales archaeon]|nr:HAD family hydrolase [Desulfurococcales archaeon]
MEAYADIACKLIEAYADIPCGEARRRYLQLAGRPFREQLRLMGIPPEKIETIAVKFEREKVGVLERAKPSRLVYERIEALRRRGLKTALSTNNECKLMNSIPWARELFDIILCHDPETGLRKGAPHVEVLEREGFKTCEIVFVGDADYDLEVYKPFNVKSIRTKGLWNPEDRAIEDIIKLLEGEHRCGERGYRP